MGSLAVPWNSFNLAPRSNRTFEDVFSSSRLPACPAEPAARVPGSHGNAAATPKPEPDE